MGSFFSRKKQSPYRKSNQKTMGNRINNADRTLLRDSGSYIRDLTEFGAKLDQLEQLLSGNLLIPVDIAAEALGLDSKDLESYVQALNIKAEQLKNTKLFLTLRPDFPNADLLMQLLKEVEPKCSAMSKKLLLEGNVLSVANREGGSDVVTTQDQSDNGHNPTRPVRRRQSPQPGLSTTSILSLPSASGTNVHGNTAQHTAQTTSVAESRGLSLIYSQSSSSSDTLSDQDDSDEANYGTKRKSSRSADQKLRSIEEFRRDNLIHDPKRIIIDRSNNILDSVLPLYETMSSKNRRRLAAVKFSGEEGTDMGALTREFFFIAFEAVISGTFKGQRLMVGERGHLIPNSMVNCRVFCYLGRMIVHAVMNSSRGVCGISPAIVQYLVSDTSPDQLEDSHPPLSIEDVDDARLKQLLEKYEKGEDLTDSEDEEWVNLMTDSNCSVNWRNKETRSYVVQHLLFHFVFWKRLPQIQALEEGLKSGGLKEFLIKNPSDANISEVFPSGENLAYSADSVVQILITRGNDFDPKVWEFFVQFLKDLYNQDIDGFSLPDLMQFVTSSPYFPERLVVSFNDNVALPEAHACYNEIVLPSSHETYPQFKEAMVKALQNGLTGYQFQ